MGAVKEMECHARNEYWFFQLKSWIGCSIFASYTSAINALHTNKD